MKVTDRRSVPEATTLPPRLRFKTAESASGQLIALDDAEGIVTAIVSVTGTEDEVADIIVPGAYAETLTKRRPKVCWAHSWEHPIGRVLHIEELMPGDDRLPTQTKDGAPWPREAGALVATMQFNMRTREGKDAFEAVRFYSETGECEYSIGYQVPPGKSTRDGKGVRHIKALDLYELSVVLFGAHTMTGTISIKAALLAALERKNARGKTGTVAAPPRVLRSAKDVLSAVRSGAVVLGQEVKVSGDGTAEPEVPLRDKWADGVMVAVYPDPAAADAIAKHIAGPDETIEREDLHVTLAFLGKADEVSMTADEIYKRVSDALEGEDSLTGIVGGIGTFPDNGDGAPTWAPVDVPGLNLLRETVVEALGDVVKNDHGFTPHMTLGYDIGVIDPLPEVPVTFSEVRVVYADNTRNVPLRAAVDGDMPWDNSTKGAVVDPNMPLSEAARLTAIETLFQMGPVQVKAEGGADRNRGGAEDLRKYWLPGGAGGAQIGWNTPGDFTRCVTLLSEHMTPENAKGYCFTGETEVITRDGVATLADLAGTDPILLTHDAPTSPHASPVRRDGRWVQAPVRSYGEQRVLRVTLRRGQDRKVIGATPEHEWFASTDARSEARKRAVRLTTADLRPGMALTALMPGAGGAVRSLPSPFGVAAGVVFGDGHVQPGRGALVDLWDEKDAYLLRYFEGTRQEQRKTAGGVLGVRVSGLPASWKAAPSLDEGTSYLYGWLAGYIAADGTVGERGNVTLSSVNPDHLRHAAAVAHRLGIATHPIKGHDRVGLGTVPTTLYRMTFVGTTVPADLLVLPEHKRRFEAATRRHEAVRWVVESVEDHGEREEVFCADVPGTHTFALADYLWVANCANRHKEATGVWPGDKANKHLDATLEAKAADIGGAGMQMADILAMIGIAGVGNMMGMAISLDMYMFRRRDRIDSGAAPTFLDRAVSTGGALIDALGRLWDPSLHPRDPVGRFARKSLPLSEAQIGAFDAAITTALGGGNVDIDVLPDGTIIGARYPQGATEADAFVMVTTATAAELIAVSKAKVAAAPPVPVVAAKGLTDSYDPSLESKVGETPAVGGKGYPRLAGSMEERQDALSAALTETLRGEALDESEGRYEWPGVSIDATFGDHVIVSRYKWDGTDDRETYDIPYTFGEDGRVELGDLEPVELQVVALGVNGEDVDEVSLGDIIPFADDVEQIARAFKAAHHSSMQTKAGRVLSGQNERRLREALENLVNVLAAAGVKLPGHDDDDDAPEGTKPPGKSDERKPVDPSVDTSTTSPTASKSAQPGAPVILDADAVAARIAALTAD